MDTESTIHGGILRKPEYWANKFGDAIAILNGWREESPLGRRPWDEPITEEEYRRRAAESTLVPRR